MTQPKFDCGDPRRIPDQLDETGVVCLENAVSAQWLAQARAAVENWLTAHGEDNHFISSPRGAEHQAVADFIASRSVHTLLNEVVRARFPDGSVDAELTDSTLRIIAGPRSEGYASRFHYDAGVVTMCVPIILPDSGPGTSGELVGFFNNRPFRRSVVVNIVEKFIIQTGFYRSRIQRRLGRNDDAQIVDMEVGNLYLFWGYRSLHGNLPCQPGAVRATLLLHFGRPHTSGGVLSAAVRLEQTLRGRRQKGKSPTEATTDAY
jgi:hypothetical protein